MASPCLSTKLLDRVTDQDDPYWESLVDDYYDTRFPACGIPTTGRLLAIGAQNARCFHWRSN